MNFAFLKDFLDLVNQIEDILGTVSLDEGDASLLANDIANFERSLALVRYVTLLWS